MGGEFLLRAAPAVAGHVALIFEESQAKGVQLSAQQTKEIVIKASRRNPPTGTTWNNRYGYGRIDTAQAIQWIMATGVPAGGAATKKKKPNTTATKKQKKASAKKRR